MKNLDAIALVLAGLVVMGAGSLPRINIQPRPLTMRVRRAVWQEQMREQLQKIQAQSRCW